VDLTGVTDEAIIIGARRDTSTFGTLFERHHRDLIGYFMRRTADAQAAADLTGEVFAAAFVGRRRFTDRGPGSGRAWLFGIARNQLAHYSRRQQVSDRHRRKLAMERVVVDEDTADHFERLADIVGLRNDLQLALATLPDNQIAAIRLRVIDELPYRDVAQQLGCTEGAARVRVARGLTRLAEVLAP
jgi:RNA polymerase sigma-70 factor (ECF subfamily)